MKIFKTVLPLLGLSVLCALNNSCTKGTQTVTKTVTDTLTIIDTVAPVVPNYADSVKKGEWAYYKFDGNMSDSSGNNRNITPYNSIALGTDIWGNASSALDFNGTNNYAVIDSGVNFPGGPFAVSFLMMPRTLTGRIFQKADYTTGLGASITFGFNTLGNTQNFDFAITNDPDVCSDPTTSTNSNFLLLTQVEPLYAWLYVTLNFDGTNESVYVNGQLQGSLPTTASTFAVCPTAPIYLGMWWTGDTQPFDGKIDELRIYTRALSVNEIKYLATAALNQP